MKNETAVREELSESLRLLASRLEDEGARVEELIQHMEEDLPVSIHGFAQERLLEDLQHFLYRFAKRFKDGLMSDKEFKWKMGEEVDGNE